MAPAESALLFADLGSQQPPPGVAGLSLLPAGVDAMHEVALVGPFVLQIDEAVDLTLTEEERRPSAGPRPSRANRMLKLRLTDGQQWVSAIEYRRVPNLADEPIRGTKLLVSNIVVRRGLLLLCPTCVSVAGGAALSATTPGATQPIPAIAMSPPPQASSVAAAVAPPPPQPPSQPPPPQQPSQPPPQARPAGWPAAWQPPTARSPMQQISPRQPPSQPRPSPPPPPAAMVLPLPPAPRDSTQPAADAGAAAPAPPGWHQPTAASPNPLLSLRVACRRWESGELFILGGQRATVRASCTRLTKFTVEDEEYRTDVELSEPDEGGSFTCELAVDHALVFSILRQPAALVAQQIRSEEKAVRKLAKQATKAANAHFHQLEGAFVLGSGPRGLTVYELPQRAPCPTDASM